MAPTSDERREVAARLRDDNHGYSTEYDFFLHALGMSREGRSPCDWAKVHERLADLIDPTCENKYRNGGDRSFLCSKCGYEAFTYCDSDCDPSDFAFCPHCGARVADE